MAPAINRGRIGKKRLIGSHAIRPSKSPFAKHPRPLLTQAMNQILINKPQHISAGKGLVYAVPTRGKNREVQTFRLVPPFRFGRTMSPFRQKYGPMFRIKLHFPMRIDRKAHIHPRQSTCTQRPLTISQTGYKTQQKYKYSLPQNSILSVLRVRMRSRLSSSPSRSKVASYK